MVRWEASNLWLLVVVALSWIPVMTADPSEGELSPLSGGMARQETCDLLPLMLTIHPPPRYRPRCPSSTVMTFGCRGQCASYVKASEDDPTDGVHRHCQCCQPTRFGVQLATIQCRDGTKLRTALKFAMECLCRPCLTENQAISMDLPEMVALGQDDPKKQRLLSGWFQFD